MCREAGLVITLVRRCPLRSSDACLSFNLLLATLKYELRCLFHQKDSKIMIKYCYFVSKLTVKTTGVFPKWHNDFYN